MHPTQESIIHYVVSSDIKVFKYTGSVAYGPTATDCGHLLFLLTKGRNVSMLDASVKKSIVPPALKI